MTAKEILTAKAEWPGPPPRNPEEYRVWIRTMALWGYKWGPALCDHDRRLALEASDNYE